MDFLFYLDWWPRLAHLYTGFTGVFPGVYRSPTLCRRVTCLLVLFLSWMRPIGTYRTVGMTVQRFIFCPTYNLLFFVVSFTREKRKKKGSFSAHVPTLARVAQGREHSNIKQMWPGLRSRRWHHLKGFLQVVFVSSVPKNQLSWQTLNGCRGPE